MQIEDGAGRQLEEIRKPAGAASTSTERRARRSWTACARAAPRTAARRPTSSPASRTRSTARPAPAERAPNPDQSWYAAYVDDPVQPIVVVVTIEKGGFGAETAAPAARLILSKWFGVSDDEFHAGTSATR